MATDTRHAALTSPGYFIPFVTVTVLFFIFGFITTLNMALVPHLKSVFDLKYGPAMLADSAFFLAFFVFSSPSSKLIELIGYKRTMVVSLFIQVVGCLLFIPAAMLLSFPLFLTAVFIVGGGVNAQQIMLPPHVHRLDDVFLSDRQLIGQLGISRRAPQISGQLLDRLPRAQG